MSEGGGFGEPWGKDRSGAIVDRHGNYIVQFPACAERVIQMANALAGLDPEKVMELVEAVKNEKFRRCLSKYLLDRVAKADRCAIARCVRAIDALGGEVRE